MTEQKPDKIKIKAFSRREDGADKFAKDLNKAFAEGYVIIPRVLEDGSISSPRSAGEWPSLSNHPQFTLVKSTSGETSEGDKLAQRLAVSHGELEAAKKELEDLRKELEELRYKKQEPRKQTAKKRTPKK